MHLSVSGVKGTVFQRKLGEYGACVSMKSACSTEEMPSKAVYVVSFNHKDVLPSRRVSLIQLTAQEKITEFLQIFDRCYKELLP